MQSVQARGGSRRQTVATRVPSQKSLAVQLFSRARRVANAITERRLAKNHVPVSVLRRSLPLARAARAARHHPNSLGTTPTPARVSTPLGVAPGMGRKSKVKVLLEPRQTESNTESSGYPVREVGWKP
jgi:hypothetical protein